jgi:hypothetical protein
VTNIWKRIRGTNGSDLTCRELVDLVTDYLEGALTEAERKRFDDHVRECTGCENYIDQMHETIALVGRVRVDDLSDETKLELLTAFRGWARS